ncbi:hypothetical protein [Bradyrhizobium sp. USDA 4350]
MHVTHSHNATDPLRIFRASILNAAPVPEGVRATLEARGINTDELEHRLRQSLGFKL